MPSDFDPNPTLQASAALLDLSPPGSSTVLLHQVATFVHFVLGHFNVSLKSINDLVKVSLRVARDQQENTIVSAVLGLTSTGLSGLSMPSATMVSLLQVSQIYLSWLTTIVHCREEGSRTLANTKQFPSPGHCGGIFQVCWRAHPITSRRVGCTGQSRDNHGSLRCGFSRHRPCRDDFAREPGDRSPDFTIRSCCCTAQCARLRAVRVFGHDPWSGAQEPGHSLPHHGQGGLVVSLRLLRPAVNHRPQQRRSALRDGCVYHSEALHLGCV